MSAKNFHEIPSPSGESRATTASPGVDPCEGMAKPAAGDASDSQHGLSLDQRAFDSALRAWHTTYTTASQPLVGDPDTDRQQFEDAVAEALEAALAVYLRETRPNGAPVTLEDFLDGDDVDELVPSGWVLDVRPWSER